MTKHGLVYKAEQLIITDLSEKESIGAAQQILKMKNRPDGLFIAKDLCAAVCMQYLKEAGIRVPDDIAIVGFNNDTISRIVEPKLSTVNYPGREMGEAAARNLIYQLNGVSSTDYTDTIILKSALIIRASSKNQQI